MKRSREIVHVRINTNHPRSPLFFIQQEVNSKYTKHPPQLERVTKLPYHTERLVIVQYLLRECTSYRSEWLSIDLLIRGQNPMLSIRVKLKSD